MYVGLNLGPHACKASSLTAELVMSPAPLKSIFNTFNIMGTFWRKSTPFSTSKSCTVSLEFILDQRSSWASKGRLGWKGRNQEPVKQGRPRFKHAESFPRPSVTLSIHSLLPQCWYSVRDYFFFSVTVQHKQMCAVCCKRIYTSGVTQFSTLLKDLWLESAS